LGPILGVSSHVNRYFQGFSHSGLMGLAPIFQAQTDQKRLGGAVS
jgi:hypothetical protein